MNFRIISVIIDGAFAVIELTRTQISKFPTSVNAFKSPIPMITFQKTSRKF